MVNDGSWTSVEVFDQRVGRVNSQVMINGRQEVAGTADAFDRVFTAFVGAADELSVVDAAPAQMFEKARGQWSRPG